MEEYKDNIVYDSYYLVNLFKNAGIKVTQLQIQKIMYFLKHIICAKKMLINYMNVILMLGCLAQ